MWQPGKYKTWPRVGNQIYIQAVVQANEEDRENLSLNPRWKDFALPGFPSTFTL